MKIESKSVVKGASKEKQQSAILRSSLRAGESGDIQNITFKSISTLFSVIVVPVLKVLSTECQLQLPMFRVLGMSMGSSLASSNSRTFQVMVDTCICQLKKLLLL